MKAKLFRYWYAMNASAVQSTAHSVKAWLAVAAAHAANDSIPALGWKQFIAVVGFFWLLAIVDWLDKNPLPTFDTQFLSATTITTPQKPEPPKTL